MYVLNLAEDNRILSAWVVIEGQSYEGMPVVDTLPEGDITDYKYINNGYVYDPLPRPEPIEPEPTEYVSYDEMAAAIKEGVNSYNG